MFTRVEINGVTITLTQEQLDQIAAKQVKSKTKEERFLQLISCIDIQSPVMDFEIYGNRLFWFDKEGKCICTYSIENGWFWLNYDRIWSVFYVEFGLNYNEVQTFMRTMVEQHFKLKGVTPFSNR